MSLVTDRATRWLTALVATALVLAFLVGSDAHEAEAIGAGETKIVYVADGYNFPDALMGATLAALNGAPMLGVRGPASGDFVPDRTAAELDRLSNNKANKLDTIYIFGGPAAVSDNVKAELAKWASNVQRISGDDRFGTMEAISKMLPAKAKDADLLDGKDSTDFLGATSTAADSDKLDGKDSTDFLGATSTAADSDKLDGMDSSAFVPAATVVTFRVALSFGESQEFVSNGPVGLVAQCRENISTDQDEARILAVTRENGAFMQGDTPHGGPGVGSTYLNTDTPEDSRIMGAILSSTNPDEPAADDDIDTGFVLGPAGQYIGIDETTVYALRVGGSDCLFIGVATVTS